MKLFASAFFAAAAAIDCPNSVWEDVDGVCQPMADQYSVTCGPASMTVVLNTPDLLYVNLDPSYEKTATSAAYADQAGCASYSDAMVEADGTTGAYTLNLSLNSCMQSVVQEGGYITFSTRILGNVAGITTDNIITTDLLKFDVSCKYADNMELTIDSLHIEQADTALAGVDEETNWENQFELATYLDSGFANAVSSSAMVTIGSPVYAQVRANGLPDNMLFFVTSCTASNYANAAAALADDGATFKTYPLLEGGCESDLVAQDSANYIGLTNVNFNFNAFTFDAGADQLHLSCAVKLCATSGIGADLTTLETDCAQVETCSVTGDQAAAVSTTL